MSDEKTITSDGEESSPEITEPAVDVEKNEGAAAADLADAPTSSGSPFAVYSLSLFFPGLGQIYYGAIHLGLSLFAIWLLSGIGAGSIYYFWPVEPLASDWEAALIFGLEGCLALCWCAWAYSIFDATRIAFVERKSINRQDRVYSFVYNFFAPGWGQAADGKFFRAMIYALIFSVGTGAAAAAASLLGRWNFLAAPENRLFAERLTLVAIPAIIIAPAAWLAAIFSGRLSGRRAASSAGVDPLLLRPLLTGRIFLRVLLAGMVIFLASMLFLPRGWGIDRLEVLKVRLGYEQFTIIPEKIESLQKLLAANPSVLENPEVLKEGAGIAPLPPRKYPPPIYGRPATDPGEPADHPTGEAEPAVPIPQYDDDENLPELPKGYPQISPGSNKKGLGI